MSSNAKLDAFNPATTTYYVTCAAANMPSSCWGVYRRVAVMAWDSSRGPRPKTIRETRSATVVYVWEKLNVGVSERCAYARAVVEAEAARDDLEAARIASLAMRAFDAAI